MFVPAFEENFSSLVQHIQSFNLQGPDSVHWVVEGGPPLNYLLSEHSTII